jgi:hypothetical protein
VRQAQVLAFIAPMLTVKHVARDPELHRLWRCVEAIRPAFQGNQQGGPSDPRGRRRDRARPAMG